MKRMSGGVDERDMNGRLAQLKNGPRRMIIMVIGTKIAKIRMN